MLTKDALRDFALNVVQVDKIGVANIERFDGAPPDMHPRNIMPRARSVVVFAKRILRGAYRGIDEGTHWPSYSIFCYAGLNGMLGKAGYRIARFIERGGFDATHVSSGATSREWGVRGPAPAPGMPQRDVILHHRIAATLAGLGEIGWSKVFLTREFGPRQRLGVILTEAELEPDPIVTGVLCDRCKRCVLECPAGAIDRDRAVTIQVEGHTIQWGDLDLGKCKLTHFGLNKKSSPFFVRRFPGVRMTVDEQEVTWREAWDLGYAMFPTLPPFQALASHPVAACGARGCIVGCMKHMEQGGKVDNTFHDRPVFSEAEPWLLGDEPTHRSADHHGFIHDPEAEQVQDPEVQQGSAWY